MKKFCLLFFVVAFCLSSYAQYVDLGLPSGTKWKSSNETGGNNGLYTYFEAIEAFGNKLPTKEQFEELKDKCKWTWNGNGYKVTGPNGNSIVLPAAGSYSCGDFVEGKLSSWSLYWSSTSDEFLSPFTLELEFYAWCLRFNSGGMSVSEDEQCSSASIRLVTTSQQQSQANQTGSSCPSTVKDYDGNTYNTVLIGNQCWMKENLRTTHYANGSSISLGNISKYSFTYAYRYQPDDNSSNVSTYGYLYNWPAVMHGASGSEANPSGVQGICPSGWHVPSEAEWRQLKDYVGSQSKFVCGGNRDNIAKALSSTAGWSSQYRALGESRYVNNNFECSIGNNLSANNGTGFSALPAGEFYASKDGENYRYKMYGFGTEADFWTSTSSGTDINGKQRANRVFLIGHCDRYEECRTLDINHVSLSSDAHSVRCIRD